MGVVRIDMILIIFANFPAVDGYLSIQELEESRGGSAIPLEGGGRGGRPRLKDEPSRASGTCSPSGGRAGLVLLRLAPGLALLRLDPCDPASRSLL